MSSEKEIHNSQVMPEEFLTEDVGTDGELEPYSNQTQFSEEVVIEDVHYEPGDADSVEATVWWKSKKSFVFIGIGTLVTGMIMVLLFLQVRNEAPMLEQTPTETVNETSETLSELERRLLLLDQDIEAADPLQAELAFPPVDYTLTLEDASSPERLQELQQGQ